MFVNLKDYITINLNLYMTLPFKFLKELKFNKIYKILIISMFITLLLEICELPIVRYLFGENLYRMMTYNFIFKQIFKISYVLFLLFLYKEIEPKIDLLLSRVILLSILFWFIDWTTLTYRFSSSFYVGYLIDNVFKITNMLFWGLLLLKFLKYSKTNIIVIIIVILILLGIEFIYFIINDPRYFDSFEMVNELHIFNSIYTISLIYFFYSFNKLYKN
jgi:hypothetical protein